MSFSAVCPFIWHQCSLLCVCYIFFVGADSSSGGSLCLADGCYDVSGIRKGRHLYVGWGFSGLCFSGFFYRGADWGSAGVFAADTG